MVLLKKILKSIEITEVCYRITDYILLFLII